VAAQSKAYVCGRLPAEIVGSNPTGAWMYVCCECCVLSGRGLCNELITRPGESYRMWCVVVCDLETSWMRRPWPTGGCCVKQTNKFSYNEEKQMGKDVVRPMSYVPLARKCYWIILSVVLWSGRSCVQNVSTCSIKILLYTWQLVTEKVCNLPTK
jgi:hypothetical protein